MVEGGFAEANVKVHGWATRHAPGLTSVARYGLRFLAGPQQRRGIPAHGLGLRKEGVSGGSVIAVVVAVVAGRGVDAAVAVLVAAHFFTAALRGKNVETRWKKHDTIPL